MPSLPTMMSITWWVSWLSGGLLPPVNPVRLFAVQSHPIILDTRTATIVGSAAIPNCRGGPLALITVAATLAYLGLAILGWGGFAACFSHSALIALTILLFALSGVAIFSDGNLDPRGARGIVPTAGVIIAFGLIGLLAAYLPAYADRKGFWTLDGDAIRWLGVVLFAAGGALRIWPVFVLGHRFSGLVAIQPGHKLVTSGLGSSVTRAIWGCSSTRWDGARFRSGSGYCSRCSLFRRSSRAFVLKSGCCVRSSAANTMSTAPARRGSFRGSIEAGSCRRTILSPPGLGADGRSSRKHFGARWPQDAPWSAFWGGHTVSFANSATLEEV